MADGSANIYLTVAAILQAARLGATGDYRLQAAEDRDGLENVRETRHVPSSLAKALGALDKDKSLREAVGAEICDAQLFLKRDEAKRLDGKSVDDVRNYYLPFV